VCPASAPSVLSGPAQFRTARRSRRDRQTILYPQSDLTDTDVMLMEEFR
jgi:hypothetical protein